MRHISAAYRSVLTLSLLWSIAKYRINKTTISNFRSVSNMVPAIANIRLLDFGVNRFFHDFV